MWLLASFLCFGIAAFPLPLPRPEAPVLLNKSATVFLFFDELSAILSNLSIPTDATGYFASRLQLRHIDVPFSQYFALDMLVAPLVNRSLWRNVSLTQDASGSPSLQSLFSLLEKLGVSPSEDIHGWYIDLKFMTVAVNGSSALFKAQDWSNTFLSQEKIVTASGMNARILFRWLDGNYSDGSMLLICTNLIERAACSTGQAKGHMSFSIEASRGIWSAIRSAAIASNFSQAETPLDRARVLNALKFSSDNVSIYFVLRLGLYD